MTHTRTTDNEYDVTSGQSNPDLSAVGIKEAANLKVYTENVLFDLAFTSDLLRCVHTAELALKGNNIKIIPDKRLREIDYGEYTGKPRNEVRPQRLRFITEPYPHGESYQDVLLRWHKFLSELKDSYDSMSVLIVGHSSYPLEVLINKLPIQDVLYDVLSQPKQYKLT